MLVNGGVNRLTHIDVAKGLGIILTVLGHCLVFSGFVGSRLFAFIYAFHMPYFFFLSGYVYKRKDPHMFFANSIKRLLIPAILYQSINLLIYSALVILHKNEGFYYVSFGGFWFLITLLYISVMYYTLDLITEKIDSVRIRESLKWFIAFLFLALGLVYASYISDQPNQPIATAFVGYFFYSMGKYLYQWEADNLKKMFKIIYGATGALLLLGLFLSIKLNIVTVDMNTSRYGLSWIFLPQAILGTLGLYFIAVCINNNRLLEYFGRNSLIILLIHIPISKAVPFLLGYFGASSVIKLSTSVVVALLFSYLSINVFTKYLPFMAGKVEWDDLYGI